MEKILMVFYSFAPTNNCAAIPNTKLVKYLEKENPDITLITNAVTGSMNTDENLLPDNVRKLRRISVGYSRLYASTFGRKRQQLTQSGAKLKMKAETRPFRAWVVSILKNVYFTVSHFDWLHSAKRAIRKQLRGEHFDVVYSSYPSSGTHTIARYVLRRRIADKWIADFRDPMSYAEYNKRGYKSGLRAQHKIEKKADHVTIVSEGALEKFKFDDVPLSKITYIPNGFDHDDFDVECMNGAASDGRLRIFYAGTLYAGKRDLTPMFRAISELTNEGKIDASRISIEYAGNEWPIMLSFAEKFGLGDSCTNYGYITRSHVMEIMAEIDCSIVCTHNTKADKGVVTGKVFELLLVGKPIIAVVGGDEPDSELGCIVRQCKAGVVYEQAREDTDYPALKNWIKNRYDEKMANGFVNSELDTNERGKYSYQHIAHDLYEIIKQTTDGE